MDPLAEQNTIRTHKSFRCGNTQNITEGHLRGNIYSSGVETQYYIYILARKRNGTLYIGVTSNLIKRVYEHKNNLVDGFSKKYNVHNLVYYETTRDIISAIKREK